MGLPLPLLTHHLLIRDKVGRTKCLSVRRRLQRSCGSSRSMRVPPLGRLACPGILPATAALLGGSSQKMAIFQVASNSA